MNPESKNRTPPTAVARQLRKESGFGCVVCGLPIIQYHHIVQWSDENHFRPEDMMVLCPNHHDEAHHMSEQEQRKLKLNPINIKKNIPDGNFRFKIKEQGINFGGIKINTTGDMFQIDGESILALNLDGERLLLSVKLYNKKDELVLQIVNNEWIFGNSKIWDMTLKYNKLTVHNSSKDIAIIIDGSAEELTIRGSLYKNNSRFRFTEKKFNVFNSNSGVETMSQSIENARFINYCFNYNSTTRVLNIFPSRY